MGTCASTMTFVYTFLFATDWNLEKTGYFYSQRVVAMKILKHFFTRQHIGKNSFMGYIKKAWEEQIISGDGMKELITMHCTRGSVVSTFCMTRQNYRSLKMRSSQKSDDMLIRYQSKPYCRWRETTARWYFGCFDDGIKLRDCRSNKKSCEVTTVKRDVRCYHDDEKSAVTTPTKNARGQGQVLGGNEPSGVYSTINDYVKPLPIRSTNFSSQMSSIGSIKGSTININVNIAVGVHESSEGVCDEHQLICTH